MENKTFMRVDKELLAKLKAKKLVQGESYANVVRRMINKEQEIDNLLIDDPNFSSKRTKLMSELKPLMRKAGKKINF